MNRSNFYYSFVLLACLTACSAPNRVLLDQVQIRANAPGSHVYQSSYPKTTDILHTKLELSFHLDSNYAYGKASIRARPYFYPSNKAVLNAKGFRINSVLLLNGSSKQSLKYTYEGQLLSIQLDRQYANNEEYTLFIDYVSMPYKLKIGRDISSSSDRGLYFINADGRDKSKPREIWTQGETECNSTWFPTIDGPQEKMTQEIVLTVPDDMVTLSNGLLTLSEKNPDGTRTDTWKQDKPHSTYLTMIAVGDFVVTKDQWRGKEVSYYTEQKFAPYARMVFGKTPEMIEFFSNKMAFEYPWDKYSQIVVRDFAGGAMENTSATVFFERMNMTEGQFMDQPNEDIISHELFHHWFGDLVTAESWANLPLNEAFATYGEYLWNEFKYGRDYADYYGFEDMVAYLPGDKTIKKDLIRFDYADREQMFDEVTYQKGGRILHMLRKTVGDEAFFKALNLYLTSNSYKTAEVHDLRLAFEEVTGQDLNWFFSQWFLASGHPVLNIQTGYNAINGTITVNIKQSQDRSNTPLYKLPIAIDLYTNGSVRREEIILDMADQSFQFTSSTEPLLINVDAEKYLLAEKTENKSVLQYAYQYDIAPLFMDRYEAIKALQALKAEEPARITIIRSLKDKNWAIRKMAVDFIPQLTEEEKRSLYETVKDMALNDPRSYVRAAAIIQLKKTYAARSNREIYNLASKDKAISVIEALNAND